MTLSDRPAERDRISGAGSAVSLASRRAALTVGRRPPWCDEPRLSAVRCADRGKLAQLGARLIDFTAKKLAGEFFNFAEALSPPRRRRPARLPKKRHWPLRRRAPKESRRSSFKAVIS